MHVLFVADEEFRYLLEDGSTFAREIVWPVCVMVAWYYQINTERTLLCLLTWPSCLLIFICQSTITIHSENWDSPSVSFGFMWFDVSVCLAVFRLIGQWRRWSWIWIRGSGSGMCSRNLEVSWSQSTDLDTQASTILATAATWTPSCKSSSRCRLLLIGKRKLGFVFYDGVSVNTSSFINLSQLKPVTNKVQKQKPKNLKWESVM